MGWKSKEKKKQYWDRYYQKNKISISIKNKTRRNRPEHKIREMDRNLQKRYGISLQYAISLLEKQEYLCPICLKSLKELKWVVDHNHSTGQVRGILCDRCNLNLGALGDRVEPLQRAIKYLTNHPSADPENPVGGV